MSALFAFSPLFFFNVGRLITQREKISQDADMQRYARGLGFDQKQVALPRWLPLYFAEDPQNLLKLPYRLPTIDIPTVSLLRPIPPIARSNALSGVFSGVFAVPKVVNDDNEPTVNLHEGTANEVINLIREAIGYAAKKNDMITGVDEMEKQKGAILNGQYVDEQSGVYDQLAGRDPTALDITASKYREDLGKILPYMNAKQAYDLISFSQSGGDNHRAQMGRQLYFDAISSRPWNSYNPTVRPGVRNRVQMIIEAGSKFIREGQKLPIKKNLIFYQDFLNQAADWANASPFKMKDAKEFYQSRMFQRFA